LQNDFCVRSAGSDHHGRPTSRPRPCSPIAPAGQGPAPPWRAFAGPRAWGSTGQPGRTSANMPPKTAITCTSARARVSASETWQGHGAPVLQKDSWAARLLVAEPPPPWKIAAGPTSASTNHAIQRIRDTPPSIRSCATWARRTILFAGVNTANCGCARLTLRNFPGVRLRAGSTIAAPPRSPCRFLHRGHLLVGTWPQVFLVWSGTRGKCWPFVAGGEQRDRATSPIRPLQCRTVVHALNSSVSWTAKDWVRNGPHSANERRPAGWAIPNVDVRLAQKGGCSEPERFAVHPRFLSVSTKACPFLVLCGRGKGPEQGPSQPEWRADRTD